MPEPTISELLAWVSLMEERWTKDYLPDPDMSDELNDPHRHAKSIRALLEHYQQWAQVTEMRHAVNKPFVSDDLYIAAVERRAIEAVLELERVKAAKLENITIYGYTIDQVTEILASQDKIKLEAIRAFVTQVGAKYTVEHPTVVVPEFMEPWWDALAEMEKDNAGTND